VNSFNKDIRKPNHWCNASNASMVTVNEIWRGEKW